MENLTPHPVKIGDWIIPPSPMGNLRLVSTEASVPRSIFVDGHEVAVVDPPVYTGLKLHPNPSSTFTSPQDFEWTKVYGKGITKFIVSSMVGEFISTNHRIPMCEFYAPDTNPDSVVRDSGGQIAGVKRLIRY
jgi:hypothetical protein